MSDFVDGLQRWRKWAALGALALGGMGIGLTEFTAMGVLPEVARDLLPTLYLRSEDDSFARASLLITVYAAGVVIGGPVIAVAAARVPRRRLLIGLLVMLVAGTGATAVAPNFAIVLVFRFIAGMPHGAYFGTAGLIASSIFGPGRGARGYAIVLSGLTVATVIGVPTITKIGQVAGWRVSYLAVTLVFVAALVAVAVAVPPSVSLEGSSPRAEFRAYRSWRVWLAIISTTIGFAGFFAVDSYIAPIVTFVTGLSTGFVPWALFAVGLGMMVAHRA
ncbi:MFS transporter [Actinospica robiniae]|uniref:MFS transporter n=1 Tax=Actinospica robiniae TaxID=304901 RepID=UPI0012FAD87F|nr:MFS transporter [Actinospica robiniae]